MKVYISGAIASDPEYKTKFQKAANDLTLQGFTVLNPAVLPEGMSRAEYMAINLPMLMMADMMMLLPDYEQSQGALLERHLCQYIAKPIVYYDGGAEE